MLMHYPFCHMSFVRRQFDSRHMILTSEHFSYDIRPFIQDIVDVQADENYGFRAIAALLGLGEDGWSQVRNDLVIRIG